MVDDQLSLRLSDGRAAPDRGGDLDDDAVVRASLDAALEDLLRAAVAESCARIDDVFALRLAAHRHRAWALAEAEALSHRLKSGLRRWQEAGL